MRIREPVIAHKFPDVLDRVELRAFRRQRDNVDVGRHDEAGRHVPASLIDQEDSMGTRRDDRAVSDRCKFIASVLQAGMHAPWLRSVVYCPLLALMEIMKRLGQRRKPLPSP